MICFNHPYRYKTMHYLPRSSSSSFEVIIFSDIHEKIIETMTTTILHLEFEENNENEVATHGICFDFYYRPKLLGRTALQQLLMLNSRAFNSDHNS